MAGGTPGDDVYSSKGYRPEESKGLIAGHAYSVIIAKEVKGLKLLNIRNPWGTFEWGGDWSDKSLLWTKEMIDLVKPNLDENDGTFWMSFRDFIENFDCLDVCRVRNWDEVRIRGRFIRFADTDNTTVEVVQSKWIYALDVPVKTHSLITLH